MSGAYRLSAYYIAKMIGEAPLVMILPSVYFTVAYPLLGGSVASFFGILFIQILSSLAAQSAGLFFGAALDLSASITAAALFTLAAQLLGGYLANNVSNRIASLFNELGRKTQNMTRQSLASSGGDPKIGRHNEEI